MNVDDTTAARALLGRDIPNRKTRRAAGQRGPLFRLSGPIGAPRYVRRHAAEAVAHVPNRRQRKARARIERIIGKDERMKVVH